MVPPQTGDDQEARLIDGARWDLHQGWITPEVLSLQEVNAVLSEVGIALDGVALEGVELKIDPASNLYRFGGKLPSFRGNVHMGSRAALAPSDALPVGAPGLGARRDA